LKTTPNTDKSGKPDGDSLRKPLMKVDFLIDSNYLNFITMHGGADEFSNDDEGYLSLPGYRDLSITKKVY